MKRVLVIDDELAMPANAEIFIREYSLPGYKFEFCGSLEEAIRLEYWGYSLIFLDIRFEGRGDDHGIQILRQIREHFQSLPVVMLSSSTAPGILLRCWDAGANAYVIKWTSNSQFRKNLEEKLRRFARYIPKQSIIGESVPIRELRSTISTLAEYDISVLIEGETGSGKELVARALHEQSKRNQHPFVPVNCAAIPSSLIESEMFGHIKGAFTGASDRRGKVAEANGGTLFLDEVADIPLGIQVKLLRLLDTGEFVRVGENDIQHANIRIVAATNKHLEQSVKNGAFREDLYFRLNGFKINVPSLRSHAEDIPLLAEHFMELFKIAHPEKARVSSFSISYMTALQTYNWPGNIREFRNAIERAIILSAGNQIDSDLLPPAIAGHSKSGPASETNSEQNEYDASLPNDMFWPRERLMSEINMCLSVKERVRKYKGNQWKAEFMRRLYPECKAASAKGFDDLIRRLTKGPWGESNWKQDVEMKQLIERLMK